MKVLLDTHTFLWWNLDDPSLSLRAREIIADGQLEVFLSAVSVWEIVIKTALADWFYRRRRRAMFSAAWLCTVSDLYRYKSAMQHTFMNYNLTITIHLNGC